MEVKISNEGKGSGSELEKIYEQYWEQARHCENEILWLSNVFAAVVAAILVYWSRTGPEAEFTFFLALFGLFFSLIVFFIVIALSLGYEHYLTDVMIILHHWKRIDFYRHPYKPFHFKKVYRYFYQFAIALFAAIMMYSILNRNDFPMLSMKLHIAIAGIIAVVIVIAYLLPKLEIRFHSLLEKAEKFHILLEIAHICAYIFIVDIISLYMYQQYGSFRLT